MSTETQNGISKETLAKIDQMRAIDHQKTGELAAHKEIEINMLTTMVLERDIQIDAIRKQFAEKEELLKTIKANHPDLPEFQETK